MPALASLVPISILTGIGTLLVFRRASDQAAVRRAKSLVTAHLLEFRLFMDEPRLILKAQRDLIVANARFMKLMLRPVVVLALPMALLLAAMDAFYGHAPLRIGDASYRHRANEARRYIAGIESARRDCRRDSAGSCARRPSGELAHPAAAGDQRRVGAGACRIALSAKSISAGAGMHYLSERRGSLQNLLLHPTEPPLSDTEIDWIEVRYPAATILRLHWLIWFFAISAVTALALRRKFRTAF